MKGLPKRDYVVRTTFDGECFAVYTEENWIS